MRSAPAHLRNIDAKGGLTMVEFNSGISRRGLIKAGAGAGLLTMTGGLFAPAVAQSKTLKIGYVSPQSGPLALFGEADSFVVCNA